jgi:hypothetical protein
MNSRRQHLIYRYVRRDYPGRERHRVGSVDGIFDHEQKDIPCLEALFTRIFMMIMAMFVCTVVIVRHGDLLASVNQLCGTFPVSYYRPFWCVTFLRQHDCGCVGKACHTDKVLPVLFTTTTPHQSKIKVLQYSLA